MARSLHNPGLPAAPGGIPCKSASFARSSAPFFPSPFSPRPARRRRVGPDETVPDWAGGQPGSRFGVGYDRGYTEGVREGEQDARQRRSYDLRRHDAYNDGDRGYNRNQGDRDRYRDDSGAGSRPDIGTASSACAASRPTEEPSAGRLPAAGVGVTASLRTRAATRKDSTRAARTPTTATATTRSRHGEYRDGDRGYNDNYGSRELYKQNYREGFREGYEDGYRGGNRDFRR